jgi:hypothetical protein
LLVEQLTAHQTLVKILERLSGQVTCLDADYRTLAATLLALELMCQQGRHSGPERTLVPAVEVRIYRK